MQTIQNLKGFRDILPEEKKKRDFVANKIINTFKQYCFEPIETPTCEYASLLLGKSGTEADKLIYQFDDNGGRRIALRYDQTVPTARVLAQYKSVLPKYFRRYQMQNVFRADKPQKGRFREFTQCDIDIFGSTSPLADSEILACSYAVFKAIGFKEIKLLVNDRKILIDTLSKYGSDAVSVFSILQTIDKMDKIGPDGVNRELVSKGLSENRSSLVLSDVNKIAPSQNIEKIIQTSEMLGIPSESLVFTPTLIRGLDYYTGMIFEIFIPGYTAGSCGGGGRYDNLIKQLIGLDCPAVGAGVGFDRIVDAAIQSGLIDDSTDKQISLVTLFDNESIPYSLNIAKILRDNGIAAEIYMNCSDNLSKQIRYALTTGKTEVYIAGDDEIKTNSVTIKDLRTKKQRTIPLSELIHIKEKNKKAYN